MSLSCGCDSDSYADVFRQSYPTARKQHKCFDCGKTIQKGEEYEYTFSVFEGDASSIKACMGCSGIRESLTDLGFCYPSGPGELRTAYIEYLDEYAKQAVRYDEKEDVYRYPRNHLTDGHIATYDPKEPA